MLALSAILLIYSFQSRPAFLPCQSAREHSGVLGLLKTGHLSFFFAGRCCIYDEASSGPKVQPHMGHQTLPKIWLGFLYKRIGQGNYFEFTAMVKNGN